MVNEVQTQLNQYYESKGIAPVDGTNGYANSYGVFRCPKKDCCRDACYDYWKKGEEDIFCFSPPIDSVCVSQYYTDKTYCGDSIPRIVVISLSAPEPSMPTGGIITGAMNQHWRETLAMVRSLLYPFIAPEKFPMPIRNWEDEDITIVESLFVQARTAKCCSNANGGKEEPSKVYENCGGYLSEEISILEPDVIITQGNNAHPRAKKYVFNTNTIQKVKGIQGINPVHNVAHVATLRYNSRRVFWLQLHHPRHPVYYSQAGDKIALESNCVGAMRKNFVRYGKEIKKFMDNPKTYCTTSCVTSRSVVR